MNIQDFFNQDNYQVWIHSKFNINTEIYNFPVNIIKNKQILNIKSHSKIEPSWLPHTPVILYMNGFCISEFCHTVTKEKSETTKP